MVERQQRQRLRTLRDDRHLARFVVEGRATGKQLGTGSYGSVEEIEVNGLICAGKKIHDILIDAANAGVENVAGKYVQECQLMSDLRHPNITQFLGVCFLPDCQLPVLLMERLDGSLDDLLETVPNIPLALKRSILEDVSRGLLYLHKHTPQIIHRDLTAKNVLLSPYFMAKITDLGNSRIVNLQPGQLARTLSRLPGTLVYMPPEALSASSRYGPSLDLFSFGHLALFTLIQVFPGDLLEPNYPDPNNPRQLLARSEVDRRGNYFERLERQLQESAGYPLIGLVKQCLENIPEERPTAENLVRVLEGLKSEVEGPCGELMIVDAVRQVKTAMALKKKSRESVDELAAKEEQIQHLQQQLEVANEQHKAELRQKEDEINRVQADVQQKEVQLERQVNLNEQLTTQLREKDEGYKQRGKEIQRKDEKLRQRNADISRLRREIQRLQDSLQQINLKPAIRTPLSELKGPLKLKWRRGKDLPFGMSGYPQVVVFKEKLYIGGWNASSDEKRQTVVVYDPEQDSHDTLPPYTYQYFAMAVVNNQLVLVGGWDIENIKETDKLGVWNEHSNTWTHSLPPLTTGCYTPSVATHNKWLVVMGGCVGKTLHSKVQVLDTMDSRQWYQAAPLPQPCTPPLPAIVGNMCYLLGGYIYSSGFRPSKKVFSVCLDDLISRAVSLPASTSALPHIPSPWQSLPDSPLTKSTALAFSGALLAIGGDSSTSTCTAIYHYQPSSRSWIEAESLPSKLLSQCTCLVLPSGELYVIGGGVGTVAQMHIASMHIASMQ